MLLNLLARVFQPPPPPVPYGKIKANLFPSDDKTKHCKNLPTLLVRSYNLKTLPPSCHSNLTSLLLQLSQQSSTPSNNQARPLSPNLIQEENPNLSLQSNQLFFLQPSPLRSKRISNPPQTNTFPPFLLESYITSQPPSPLTTIP